MRTGDADGQSRPPVGAARSDGAGEVMTEMFMERRDAEDRMDLDMDADDVDESEGEDGSDGE